MIKKILKEVFIIITCLIAAFILCYYFVDDYIVNVAFSGSEVEFLVIKLLLTFVLYFTINLLFNRKIKRFSLDLIGVLYLIMMLIFTFCKGTYSGINLNPLDLINEFKYFNYYNGTLLIGNMFAYLPIGLYLKVRLDMNDFILLLSFISYIVAIEFLQYTLYLGVFDINDIILNTFGFLLGILTYNFINNYVGQHLFKA